VIAIKTALHDLDAEANVLGSILLNNKAYNLLDGKVKCDMFFGEGHRLIFASIERLIARGMPADLVTISSDLRDREQLEAVGGMAYLAGLPDLVTASQYAPHYGQIVAEKALLRSLGAEAKKLLSAIQNCSSGAARLILETATTRFEVLRPEAGQPAIVKTITARDLMGKILLSPKYAVPGMIPEGLVLVVGPPKLGKSWFVLSLAVAVASGGVAFGKIPIEQGAVLYYGLEDSERRLQNRLETILGDEIAPEHLEIKTTLTRLNEGGVQEIADWLATHPNARLVIIDTFARVKPKGRHGANAYDEDTQALGPLQRLAVDRGVAVVVVHHTRKAVADDVFETVSGSTGLTGVADAILILQRKRNETDTRLHVTGRDISEAELAIKFDPTRGMWTILGDAKEFARITPERRKVIEALGLQPLSPKDLGKVIGKSSDAARNILFKMRDAGLVQRNPDGTYSPVSVSANSGTTLTPSLPSGPRETQTVSALAQNTQRLKNTSPVPKPKKATMLEADL
jgi:DNA-binding transcriptional ArsR family regulator